MTRRTPVPQCPIRVGEPCTLCVPGVTGPEDCGLVYLVRSDPELAERLVELRTAERAEKRAAERARAADGPVA